jgi:hypothetical protein
MAKTPVIASIEGRPWLDRQFGDGMWLYWRDAPDERREGLLVTGFHVCPNPACTCTEMQLHLSGVDDLFVGAEERADADPDKVICKMRFHEDRPNGALRNAVADVKVDLETGKLTDGHGDERLLSWCTSIIDAERLEILRGYWRAAKGEPPSRRARPEPAAAVDRAELRRVGRNDPCPCGSGKKHKKCCGA